MFVFFLLSCLVVGCNNQEKTQDVKQTSRNLLKELAQGDEFINLDVEVFRNTTLLPISRGGEEITKAKAMIYRFYKHVKLVDGKYLLELDNPKKLKMNMEVYELLKSNLEQMNSSIDSLKKQGVDVVISPVDAAYLNMLLN